MDFLLVLIELVSLGVTAEALYEGISVENRRFRSNGGRLTQNFRYTVSPHTNHFSSQKTRQNDLLYGIKIWTDLSSLLSQITRLTDRWTEFSSLDRVCIACSAVMKLCAIAYVFLFNTCMKISFKNLHALLKYQQKPQGDYASLCTV